MMIINVITSMVIVGAIIIVVMLIIAIFITNICYKKFQKRRKFL